MGCWNETCAMTRTPILHGDSVVMVVLWEGIFSRKNEAWRPKRLEPSECGRRVERIEFGQYNDYGWIEGLPGAHSEGMKDRTEHGKLEAYERAIFFRKSAWDVVVTAPVASRTVNEQHHDAVTANVRDQRVYDERFREVAKPEEFWTRLEPLLKVLCFCESCRIDVLGGLAFKGSQEQEVGPYKLLAEAERAAHDEWAERERKLRETWG